MTAATVVAANVRALEGSISRNRVAGGTVNMGDAVYPDSNSKRQQALATTAAAAAASGIITAVAQPGSTSAASGEGCTETVFGPVGGFSGLTPGAIYYVDDSTAGGITATAPSGTGKWAKGVGYAETDTILFVDPGVTAARSSGLA